MPIDYEHLAEWFQENYGTKEAAKLFINRGTAEARLEELEGLYIEEMISDGQATLTDEGDGSFEFNYTER